MKLSLRKNRSEPRWRISGWYRDSLEIDIRVRQLEIRNASSRRERSIFQQRRVAGNRHDATCKRHLFAGTSWYSRQHTRCSPVAFMQIMEREEKVCPVKIRRKLFRGVDWRMTKSRKPPANRCSGNFPRTLNPFDRYINITRSAARCVTPAYPGQWDKDDGPRVCRVGDLSRTLPRTQHCRLLRKRHRTTCDFPWILRTILMKNEGPF